MIPTYATGFIATFEEIHTQEAYEISGSSYQSVAGHYADQRRLRQCDQSGSNDLSSALWSRITLSTTSTTFHGQ